MGKASVAGGSNLCFKMTDEYGSSPPRVYGRIARPRGWLPLNNEEANPMAVHGTGALVSLIKSRSSQSLHTMHRRPSSVVRGRESMDDEEAGERRSREYDDGDDFKSIDERRLSLILNGPQMRSQRLIGNSNPRYKWERYWKTEEQLKTMKKPIRQYYERTNSLVQQYIYIDRLLDSSLPHDLLNEYNNTPGSGHQSSAALRDLEVPPTISEEPPTPDDDDFVAVNGTTTKKVKRMPRDLYKVSSEVTPLLGRDEEDDDDIDGPRPEIPGMEDDSVESGDRIVQIAIYVNLAANAILLAGKIAVIVLTSSLSVFMVTSFFQVGLECVSRLHSGDHSIIQLTLPAIIIMSSTVLIKFLCWLYCRLIKNSSVQALAQDAMTDVVFNIFSIIFPLVGFYAKLWWMDALGGLVLSLYVIFNWAGTSAGHIRNLSGAAATADERNVLLYLTMRFARTIKQIQGLQAYHAGDKLNVEVDIVLDENMSLRDSHDLGESLQYVLESVPTVDRAFVHQDYASWNLPTHMSQQGE